MDEKILTKAPWEMTREEMNHAFLLYTEKLQHSDMLYRAWQFARPSEVKGKNVEEKKRNFNKELYHRKVELEKAEKLRQCYNPLRHKQIIQEAAKSGKEIPDAVRKEYPDLFNPELGTDALSFSLPANEAENKEDAEKVPKSQKILAGIHASIEILEKNIESEETEKAIRDWLKYQGRFHNYSLFNTYYLYMQSLERGVTLSQVAAFRKWSAIKGTNGEHVQVKKGEHGFKIFYPQEFKVYEKDESGDYKRDENGKRIQAVDPDTGRPLTCICYGIGYVFDVAQTNAREIGAVKDLDYRGAVVPIAPETVQEIAKRITEKLGIPVYFENEPLMKAGGWYTPHTHCIVINTAVTQEDAHQLGVLFHELGHALIHGRQSPQYDRRLKEGQAEAFAYAASAAFGVERNSQLYIKTWIENEIPLQEVLKDISTHVQNAFKQLDLAELAAQNFVRTRPESFSRKSDLEKDAKADNAVEEVQKTISSMRTELYNSLLSTNSPVIFPALRYLEKAPEEKIAGLYSILKEARSDNLSNVQICALLEMKIREIKHREQRQSPDDSTSQMTFGF